jgi:hypothetical protein
LREQAVAPIEVGRTLVASRSEHRAVLLEVVRELGLERQVISIDLR